MEDKSPLILTLIEKTEKYRNTGADLLKLKGIDKSAEILSELFSSLILIIFSSLVFVMLNIAIALWLGKLIGETYIGFFIVAAFYALFAIVLYIFKDKWIDNPLRNRIITKALKQLM